MFYTDLCSPHSVIKLPDDSSDGPKLETILIRIHLETKQYANQFCHVKIPHWWSGKFLYRLSNSLSTVTKTI
jgi:hypothetical protein